MILINFIGSNTDQSCVDVVRGSTAFNPDESSVGIPGHESECQFVHVRGLGWCQVEHSYSSSVFDTIAISLGLCKQLTERSSKTEKTGH